MAAALARFASNKTGVFLKAADALPLLPTEARDEMRRLLTGIELTTSNFQLADDIGCVEFSTPRNKKFLNEQISQLRLLHETKQRWCDLSIFCLTHPKIPAATLKRFMDMPDTTSAARGVMMANPNLDQGGGRVPERLLAAYAAGVCVRGDLAQPYIQKIALEYISDGGQPFHSLVTTALCKRGDLPEELAAVLSRNPSRNDFANLCLTDGYNRFSARKENRFYNIDKVGQFGFSPYLSGQEVVDTAEELCSQRTSVVADFIAPALGALICHPNAPEGFVREMLLKNKIPQSRMRDARMRDTAIRQQSPHSELILRFLSQPGTDLAVLTDLASIRVSSASSLLEVFHRLPDTPANSDSSLEIISHPNFPWENISHTRVLAACDNSVRLEMYAAMALSVPHANLLARDTENIAVAALFSPHVSARRLEALAAAHPGLAPYAACHPNGAGIDVSKYAGPDKASEVAFFRGKFSDVELAGRTECTVRNPAIPARIIVE